MGGVGLPQPPGKLRAAADTHPEAAGGPEQEFYISLQIAIVGILHLRRAVDKRMVDGDTALVTLQSDGDGLLRVLQIGFPPDAKGDEAGVQLRGVLHWIVNA